MHRLLALVFLCGFFESFALVLFANSWSPHVSYPARTEVIYDDKHDECLLDHTSRRALTPPAIVGSCPLARTTTNCNYPDWVAGRYYYRGTIVRYNGSYYIAEHDNPGYDPTISTWFWEPYTCTDSPTPTPNPGTGFSSIVSRAQFEQMFPNRNSFYTYDGLVEAASFYPSFAGAGTVETKKREAAAALANFAHESGNFIYIVEQNTANYSHYCDWSQPYGCPAGGAAYYGRGPIQLSWNFNYKAAGDALGINLLSDPWQVERNAAIAWKTALWYWMTQNGPGTMTPHNAMINNLGFGETIRSINGSLECGGRNPAQVQSRINAYQAIINILGVTPGNNLGC